MQFIISHLIFILKSLILQIMNSLPFHIYRQPFQIFVLLYYVLYYISEAISHIIFILIEKNKYNSVNIMNIMNHFEAAISHICIILHYLILLNELVQFK